MSAICYVLWSVFLKEDKNVDASSENCLLCKENKSQKKRYFRLCTAKTIFFPWRCQVISDSSVTTVLICWPRTNKWMMRWVQGSAAYDRRWIWLPLGLPSGCCFSAPFLLLARGGLHYIIHLLRNIRAVVRKSSRGTGQEAAELCQRLHPLSSSVSVVRWLPSFAVPDD